MKLFKVLLATVACASFVLAQAAAPAAEPAAKPAKAPAGQHVKGKVVAVDLVANTIIVKTTKAEDTISVSETTKIKEAGKEVKLSDVKADANVTVAVKDEAGKKVATSISIKAAAAKKAEKKAAEPAAVK